MYNTLCITFTSGEVKRHSQPDWRGGPPAIQRTMATMRKTSERQADFADELGAGYLNLVVRRLSQRIASAGDAYIRETGVTISATSTAILAYVARHDQAAIADVALALGYSHQAVAKAVEGMERDGLMDGRVSAEDLRKRLLSLTPKGRREAAVVDVVASRAAAVFADVFDEIGVDVFKALRAVETALDRRPLAGRLLDADENAKPRDRR